MESFRTPAPKTIDQVLAFESNSTFCREKRKWAAGTLPQQIGAVYGIVTATGEIKPHDVAAVDGSQNVAGIAAVRGTATEEISGVERGPAIAIAAGLGWKVGITTPQLAASIAQLVAKEILVR